MKKTMIFAAAAAMMLVACNKETPKVEIPEISAADKVEVALKASFSDALTRAAGDEADSEAERKVNRVDVFFFRQDAAQTLDAYYTFSNPEQEGTNGAFTLGTAADPMYVSNTTLDVYVIANAPAEIGTAVSSIATLKAQISQYTQNTTTNFVMIGRLIGQNIRAIEPAASGLKTINGPLHLERIANKILFKKITKEFVSDAYQSGTVTLEGAWVLNATKEAKYDEIYTAAGDRTVDAVPTAAAASYWHAGLAAGNTTWESNPFLSQGSINAEVTAAGTALNGGDGFAFYFYPNPALEAVRPAAVAGEEQDIPEDYVTKLVLKVKVVAGSETHYYWYPIAFNQAKLSEGNYIGAPMDVTRNLIYVIDNLTLLKAGNNVEDDTPNKYIDNSAIALKIDVLDWVTGEIVGTYNGHGWGRINE